MARKKVKLYSLDGIRELRQQLQEHDRYLTAQIVELAAASDFDSAVVMRRAADRLVQTRLLTNMEQGPLATCEGLAEMTGNPQSVPFLEDCHLGESLTEAQEV